MWGWVLAEAPEEAVLVGTVAAAGALVQLVVETSSLVSLETPAAGLVKMDQEKTHFVGKTGREG